MRNAVPLFLTVHQPTIDVQGKRVQENYAEVKGCLALFAYRPARKCHYNKLASLVKYLCAYIEQQMLTHVGLLHYLSVLFFNSCIHGLLSCALVGSHFFRQSYLDLGLSPSIIT